MQELLLISCGLDVHKDSVEACILKANGTSEPETIRKAFTMMRGDILLLRDWLESNGCVNVAMESTGVYWIPVYEILEEASGGMNLCLVNSYHMRNVPGRKSDMSDAEWIATLYMCGLLQKNYVPERGIREMRGYTRYYAKLVRERVRLLNRLEKFLQTHGFKLSSVLSKIDGVSAGRILRKLSEHGYVSVFDVEKCLARGVKMTADEIAYAINGNLTEPSRALLRLQLETLSAHDRYIDEVYAAMLRVASPYTQEIELLSTIPGIDELSAMYIIAEIGTELSAFKTAGHLVSWAGLRPKNDESAGKIKSKSVTKGNYYVKSILCQCAWASTRTRNTRPSNWYWRNVNRLGKKTAIIAVSRKLLVYVYNIIVEKKPYNALLDKIDTAMYNAYKLEAAKKKISMLEGKTNVMRAISLETDRNKRISNDLQSESNIDNNVHGDKKSPVFCSPDAVSGAAAPPRKRGRPRKNPTPV